MSQNDIKPEDEKNNIITEKPTSPTNQRSYSLPQSDEIDLKLLWQQFVNLLRIVIKIVIKRGIVLAIFLGIGGGTGYYFHKVSTPVYKTKMLINAKDTDYAILSGLLGSLQDLAYQQQHQTLASVLKVNPEVTKTIVSLKAVDKLVVLKDLSAQQNKEFKANKNGAKKSTKERDKEIFQLKDQNFAIELSLTDNSHFASLETAITGYLRENKYLKKRVELKKMLLTKKKQKLQKEIKELDSLKHNIRNIFTQKNQNVQITDPGTIARLYQEAVKLKEEELKIDTTLALMDNVQIVDGFIKSNIPIVQITKRLKTGLYLGFSLWVMLILWLDVRKPFMRFLNEDSKK